MNSFKKNGIAKCNGLFFRNVFKLHALSYSNDDHLEELPSDNLKFKAEHML